MSWDAVVEQVNKQIIGRVALIGDDQAALLCQTVAVPGIHIEVGCLWGGTAILAALAKNKAYMPGHVFSIDIMRGGYWNSEDPAVRMKPTPQAVYENLINFGVADTVSVLRTSSHPWPLADHLNPVTALIDGDHSYEGCLRDWESLRERVKKKIIFHDYDARYPGVSKVIDEHVRADSRWRECDRVGLMVIFERVS